MSIVLGCAMSSSVSRARTIVCGSAHMDPATIQVQVLILQPRVKIWGDGLSNNVFEIGHNHGQLLFVHIDSGYAIRHTFLLAGSGEHARDYIKQGLGLSPLPAGGETMHHSFALSRMLRIRQVYSLAFSTVGSISPHSAAVNSSWFGSN